MDAFFPVIHGLVREWRFPHFFIAGNQSNKGILSDSPICLVVGFEKSAEIAVLGLKYLLPGVIPCPMLAFRDF